MAVTLVQDGVSAIPGKSATVTVVLGATPTSGNLLIALPATTNDNTLPTVLNQGSGKNYTLMVDKVWNSNDRCWVYARIADGTESATATFTWASGLGGTLYVGEFAPNDEWEVIGSVLGTTATTDAGSGSPSVGAVGATAESTLHVAVLSTTGATAHTSPTNSYTNRLSTSSSGGEILTSHLHKFYTAPSTSEGVAVTAGNAPNGAIHAEFLEVASASSIGAAAYHRRMMMG